MIMYGRGYVYHLKFHIVWCVKYRQKILTEQIKSDLNKILLKIAKDNDFKIEEINSNLDHIHLLISVSPQHYIPNVLKALKGVSARLIMKKHKDFLKPLLCKGHLWNPSYFIATVSENTEEQIRKYIKEQKEK